MSVVPLQIVTRHELDDALHQSERARNVVQTEKTVQSREADVAMNRRVLKDTLKLRAEIDFAILKAVVEGLDAHTVARENEPALGPHPDRDREHPSQP